MAAYLSVTFLCSHKGSESEFLVERPAEHVDQTLDGLGQLVQGLLQVFHEGSSPDTSG